MEVDFIRIITRINLHVLPLFALYLLLRSRFVYPMLIDKINRLQGMAVVGVSLLALEAVYWSNPFSEVMLLNTAVMRIGILGGMLFGPPLGATIGFCGGMLVLVQEHHGLAFNLTILALTTLCGFLAEQYKARHGPIWEKDRRALTFATILFGGALIVAYGVLLTCEPGALLAEEIHVSFWKTISFFIVFYLLQNFIMERRIINRYDMLAGEMQFARRLQMDIVSHRTEQGLDRRVRVFGALRPAKDVGGDWYDYFMLGEDKLCLIMGDVSGKGVPAALFMVVGCMLFRAFKEDPVEADPAAMLELVNNDLCEDNKAKMFITAVCAILDLQTGALVYSNVGHTKSYIRKRTGELVGLPVTNKGVLGFFSHKKYTNVTVQLQPEDVFLTYTDGVTEAQDAKAALFGSQRLEAVLASHQGTEKSLCEAILQAVDGFSAGNEQSDDTTVLAVGYGQAGA